MYFVYFFFVLPVTAKADYRDDYKTRGLFVVAANACLASYDDKVGNIFYAFLAQDGWQLQKLQRKTQNADANVFLASRYFPQTDDTFYILAFRGTASSKDVAVDKQFSRVQFVGDSIEKIQQNAQIPAPRGTVPKVHKGFLKYVLESFNIDVVDSQGNVSNLEDIIKDNPKAKIIVTGHSLGGGAAVVYAASLANIGVTKDKIKVITFGAPAVGNKLFAKTYEDKINLTRIYSRYDPVEKVLQSLRPYSQFGEKFIISADPRFKPVQHSMENYADLITKDYYDTRFEAIKNRQLEPLPQVFDEGEGAVVAFAVTTTENIYNLPTYKYAKDQLLDIYRHSFWRYRILATSDVKGDIVEAKRLAKEAGADYLVVSNITMQPVQSQKDWLVGQEQALYSCKDDKLLSLVFTSSKVSKDSSFIQAAALNSFRGLAQLSDFDIGLKYPDFRVPE